MILQGGAQVSEADHRHVKLSGVMFQNMFPTIDVNTVKLADCRRIVLTNFEPEAATIDWRHYSVTNRATGAPVHICSFSGVADLTGVERRCLEASPAARGGWGRDA
jgi:hypothetical protein